MTSVFEDHLGLDAIVAFTDGEMGLLGYQRAAAHLARCPMCAAEVAEQTTARELLRSADSPRMPGSLFDQLRSIPVAVPAAPTVPGLRIDQQPGQAVMLDGVARAPQQRRRFRMGAGFLVAGLAAGALATAALSGGSESPSTPSGRDAAQLTKSNVAPSEPQVQLARLGR